LGSGAVDDGFQCIFVKVLDDRRLQAGFVELGDIVDLDISQAPGTVDADELGVFIDFATRHAGAAWHAQCGDAAVFAVGHAGEDLEGHILDGIGDFGQFKRDAQVRLVRAEAAHRFAVSHAGNGSGRSTLIASLKT
jgi:hypothetical protein